VLGDRWWARRFAPLPTLQNRAKRLLNKVAAKNSAYFLSEYLRLYATCQYVAVPLRRPAWTISQARSARCSVDNVRL